MNSPVGTIVQRHHALSTGALITVERTGTGSWIEEDPGWATLCETHSRIVTHRTRRLAIYHATCPEDWCEDCSEIAEG